MEDSDMDSTDKNSSVNSNQSCNSNNTDINMFDIDKEVPSDSDNIWDRDSYDGREVLWYPELEEDYENKEAYEEYIRERRAAFKYRGIHLTCEAIVRAVLRAGPGTLPNKVYITFLGRESPDGPVLEYRAKNKTKDEAKEIRLETLKQLYGEIRSNSLGVADLGCSSGPNVFSTVKDIIGAVDSHHSRILGQPLTSVPELRIFLNDLPGNHINSIFSDLPDFHSELKKFAAADGNPRVYISACPGSFYGRLFPDNILHLIYSSYSLHRLSKVPPAIFDGDGKSINKGCVTICSSSPEPVFRAYHDQFKEDFATFLQSRSKELVTGGNMVLIMLGREGAEGPDHTNRGNSFLWKLFSTSLANLVAQGQIDEEQLNSFDIPFYAPRAREIQNEVTKEGSFQQESLETILLDKRGKGGQNCTYGTIVANMMRSIQESISQHFGEEIVEKLFEAYADLVDEESTKTKVKPITFSLILMKL